MGTKKIFNCEIIGLCFGTVMTAIVHMLYPWTGNSAFVAFLAPINESIYEHTKLLITPFLVYAIFEYFVVRKQVSAVDFWAIKLGIISLAPLALAIMYYTYFGMLGFGIMAVDILIGQILVALMYFASYNLLRRGVNKFQVLWITLGIVTVIIQVILSYFPLDIISWFVAGG